MLGAMLGNVIGTASFDGPQHGQGGPLSHPPPDPNTRGLTAHDKEQLREFTFSRTPLGSLCVVGGER